MDPKIWGIPMWNILFDVCWFLESKKGNDHELKKGIFYLFQSLKYLLPCIYCRESYKYFLKELHEIPPIGPGALRWIYDLKNMVNAKLKKSVTNLSYETFRCRMQGLSGMSSAQNVFDVICILALNIHCPSKDVTETQKKHAFFYFIESVEILSKFMSFPCLKKKIKKITEKDVKNRNALFRYLSTEYSSENEHFTSKELIEKYSYCKVKKK